MKELREKLNKAETQLAVLTSKKDQLEEEGKALDKMISDEGFSSVEEMRKAVEGDDKELEKELAELTEELDGLLKSIKEKS